MAGSNSALEFVREIFSPTVALVVSFDADAVCERNGISFAELLLPFSQLSVEAVFKDPNNQSHTVRQLRVDFRDLRSGGFPLNSVLSRFLTDMVKSFPLEEIEVPDAHSSSQTLRSPIRSDSALNVTTPWYEEWKTKFITLMEPGDHEFLRHFLACVLVVSSAHPDPLDQLTKLSQAQHSQQHQIGSNSGLSAVPTGISVISGDLQSNSGLNIPRHTAAPKWFSPNIFKFHLLVHDVTLGDEKKAEAVYQSMKMTYGAHACHLLRINSTQPTSDDSVSSLAELWRPFLESQFKTSNRLVDGDGSFDVGNSGFSYHRNDDTPIKSFYDEAPDATVANGTTGGLEVENYKGEVIPHPLSHTDLRVLDKEPVDSGARKPELPAKLNRVGACLTPSDVERIKVFFQEFVQRGLLPFVERQMRLLNDQFASRNWRGKSLLTATKGLFGSRATLTSPTTPQANSNLGSAVVYTQESAELQVRRLADLAFLFQHYDLAYNLYHLLKKDFANDQAWLYYAGALEMASLCVFMMGPSTSRPFRHDYIEGALSTYTSCNKYQLACRTTIFCTEMYRNLETPGKAAEQFIKMTSGESDLTSALFLEQAALCFLRDRMVRKFAIHMILAGHRYSKANQRRHTLRCYIEALKIYNGRQWRLAEDHINYTIGHQSRQLRLTAQSVLAFGNLLSSETLQFPAQQLTFVKEYLVALQECRSTVAQPICPTLVVPLILTQETQVFYGDLKRLDIENAEKLKTDAVLEKAGWLLGSEAGENETFEPTVFTAGPTSANSKPNRIPLSEYFTVELHFLNPFCLPLFLVNSHLLWSFQAEDGTVVGTDLNSPLVQTVVEPLVVLSPTGMTKAFFSILPEKKGRLVISGIQYGLTVGAEGTAEVAQPSGEITTIQSPTTADMTFLVSGCQTLELKGPRLHKTKLEKTTVVYGIDRRLEPIVGEQLPLMNMIELQSFPTTLMAGELLRLPIRLTNVGHMAISRIFFCTCTPEHLNFSTGSEAHRNEQLSWSSRVLSDNSYLNEVGSDQPAYLCELSPIGTANNLPVGGVLDVWLNHFTPTIEGQHTVDFLVYYESSNGAGRRHRSRHCRFSYSVLPSLKLSCRLYPSAVLAGSMDERGKYSAAHVELRNVSAATEVQTVQFHLLQIFCLSFRFKLAKVISDHSDFLLELSEMKSVCLSLLESPNSRPVVSESCLTATTREELQTALQRFSLPWSAFNSESQSAGRLTECLFALWKANVVCSDGSVRVTFGIHPTDIPSYSAHLDSSRLQTDLSSTEPIGFVGLMPNGKSMRGEELMNSSLNESICYSLEYNAAISHDFTKFRLCSVPVCLRVKNLFTKDVELKIEGSPPMSLTNVGGSTNYYRHGCQPISWLQVSTKGNSIVPVGGEIILSLTGVAAHPGVFDLGSLVIRASIDSFTHTSAVAIFPRQPHYVTVKQHSDWTGTVGQTD